MEPMGTIPIRKGATDTGFGSDWISCKLKAKFFYSSSLLDDSIVLQNLPNHQVNGVDAHGWERQAENN